MAPIEAAAALYTSCSVPVNSLERPLMVVQLRHVALDRLNKLCLGSRVSAMTSPPLYGTVELMQHRSDLSFSQPAIDQASQLACICTT